MGRMKKADDGSSREVEVSVLNLQRLVSRKEIRKMRELRAMGYSISRIAAILGRSPSTVSHYLKSDERMCMK